MNVVMKWLSQENEGVPRRKDKGERREVEVDSTPLLCKICEGSGRGNRRLSVEAGSSHFVVDFRWLLLVFFPMSFLFFLFFFFLFFQFFYFLYL